MAVQTRILTDSSREVVVLLSNYATTETDVVKLDASTLNGAADVPANCDTLTTDGLTSYMLPHLANEPIPICETYSESMKARGNDTSS